MKLRGSLDDIDPLSVPLPHGTEVSTRVDRVVGERRIAQGAVGRVVAIKGDVYEVNLVGHGVVSYVRRELRPRKAGQLRFAHRREQAWTALKPCVVLEATVGSRAWGLSDDGSDIDRRGVFVLPFPWTGALVEPPHDLVSADGSAGYWEVEKTVRQAIRADPNTLETLFVDSVEARDEIGDWILETRGAFVSAEIYGSFGRYALSQLKKLRQSQRLAENRSLVVRWLRDEPGLTLDQVAQRLAEASEIVTPEERDARERARQYVKQLYRSMYDQGLLSASFGRPGADARGVEPMTELDTAGTGLDAAQRGVAERVLAEESARRSSRPRTGGPSCRPSRGIAVRSKTGSWRCGERSGRPEGICGWPDLESFR